MNSYILSDFLELAVDIAIMLGIVVGLCLLAGKAFRQ